MKRDDTDWQTYIDRLRETGSYVEARRAIRVRRDTIEHLRKHDQEFADAEAEAYEEATDAMEQEARRRAIHGHEHAVFDKDGKLSGYTTKHSDTLLIFLMKGAMPERYADRVKTENTNRTEHSFTDETAAAAKIASILDTARQRREGEQPE